MKNDLFASARRLRGRGAFCMMLAAWAASACQGTLEEGDIEPAPDRLGLLHEQQLALSRMDLRISRSGAFGAIRHIAGDTGFSLAADESLAPVGHDGKKMFNRLRHLLLARGDETLTLRVNDRMPAGAASQGYRTQRYAQSIHGIPVIDGEVAVGIKDDGTVDVVAATFLPNRDLPTEPRISAEEALDSARLNLEGVGAIVEGSLVSEGSATLAYHGVAPDAEQARLVWVLPVSFTLEDGSDDSADVWIDAVDATYVDRASHLRHASRDVRFYTAGNATPSVGGYPNRVTEIDPSGDPMAEVLRVQLARTEEAWDRTTVMPLVYPDIGVVVHYGPPFSVQAFSNAANGRRWLSFGDLLFRPGANVLDVVAHEYGHGRSHTIGLRSSGPESIAVDEAYADISATVADRAVNGVSAATYEIGEGQVIGPSITQSIRSLNNPVLLSGALGHKDYYPLRWQQFGKEHENSTIVSHAFKLVAEGGQHARAGQLVSAGAPPIPLVTVPALGPEFATVVFDWALRRPEFLGLSTIPDFALATLNVAALQFQRDALLAAWQAVGVLGNTCTGPPDAPRLRVEDFLCRGRFGLDWDPVPGATTYFAERVQFGFPFSLATPVVDADVTECMIEIPVSSRIHLRACNACGCSPWDAEHSLIIHPQCQ